MSRVFYRPDRTKPGKSGLHESSILRQRRKEGEQSGLTEGKVCYVVDTVDCMTMLPGNPEQPWRSTSLPSKLETTS